MGEEWRTWNTFEVFFGIIFVGAPFTLLFEYFILEWIVTNKIQALFPAEVLATTPDSVRINVLPKLIVVSLIIGIVPVTTVGYITLGQIHRIEAGSQDIGSFVGQMPVVITFICSWAVLIAVGLSAFVARSVSKPLRHMATAMQRIRQGDLEVKIPVVSNDEIGTVTEGFNLGVAGLRERDFIRDTFGSYLSPEVVSEILKSPTGVNLGGELREVTILVSDLRGFTHLTASSPPEIVVEILNRFLEKMVDIIIRHGGTIDEFTGDGILAFFGAPRHMTDAVQRAVECAIDMQHAMPGLNRELQANLGRANEQVKEYSTESSQNLAESFPPLEMGIAISKGQLVVGNIGCETRKKYGAVGTAINEAFRIEDKALAGEILVTEEVYASVKDVFEAYPKPGAVELKGIDRPVMLYTVVV
jgi:sigma-B regulation protein RsbU (phosphoserine phosphatase)